MKFIFAVHNHQPVGNFGHVFEENYQKAYLPFLDVFENYPAVKLALHTSGSLIEWLAEEHPEYLDRIAVLVRQHRIEIIGGPFFEPILAMLPSRDRIGQIEMYSEYLKKRLGATVAGLWLPERVWEQSYVRDLVDAGMNYTILDDIHFRSASLSTEGNIITRHYLTEDDGKIFTVFPGSEKLRYLIPFGKIRDIFDYFREVAALDRQGVLVHGDDGEKFGAWSETYRHTYEEKWLHQFFDALSENSSWLQTTVPSEAVASVPPLGKIYIPDGSYREMTEWVLPPEQQQELEQLRLNKKDDEMLPVINRFLRGGFWRNFKVRYPESDEMYCRMMCVSARLNKAVSDGWSGAALELARESLYRSQCNCGYWHGSFGGVYLPHLRNTVYQELIKADNLIDKAVERTGNWVESQAADFNFDGQNEVRLTNEALNLLLLPHKGGIMYEMDVKSIAHNLLATMTRRPEAYHQKLTHLADRLTADSARIVCKQEGLDRQLQYDKYPRKSLIDLFYDYDTDLDAVQKLRAGQHGDFVQGEYNAVIRKKSGRMQVLMSREGSAYGQPVRIDKAVTFTAGSSVIDIAYRLSDLPKGYQIHFAVEFNFSGMPGGAANRYFYRPLNQTHLFKDTAAPERETIATLDKSLDLTDETGLALYDDWLGLDVSLCSNRPAGFYAFPVETVNQSEEGFELVHQSVAVQPHWRFVANETGNWTVEMQLKLDTSAAVERDLTARSMLKDAAKILVGEIE